MIERRLLRLNSGQNRAGEVIIPYQCVGYCILHKCWVLILHGAHQGVVAEGPVVIKYS